MRNRSETYRNIYSKYREDRMKEVIELKQELRELQRLVEFLCQKVFE